MPFPEAALGTCLDTRSHEMTLVPVSVDDTRAIPARLPAASMAITGFLIGDISANRSATLHESNEFHRQDDEIRCFRRKMRVALGPGPKRVSSHDKLLATPFQLACGPIGSNDAASRRIAEGSGRLVQQFRLSRHLEAFQRRLRSHWNRRHR